MGVVALPTNRLKLVSILGVFRYHLAGTWRLMSSEKICKEIIILHLVHRLLDVLLITLLLLDSYEVIWLLTVKSDGGVISAVRFLQELAWVVLLLLFSVLVYYLVANQTKAVIFHHIFLEISASFRSETNISLLDHFLLLWIWYLVDFLDLNFLDSMIDSAFNVA